MRGLTMGLDIHKLVKTDTTEGAGFTVTDSRGERGMVDRHATIVR